MCYLLQDGQESISNSQLYTKKNNNLACKYDKIYSERKFLYAIFYGIFIKASPIV